MGSPFCLAALLPLLCLNFLPQSPQHHPWAASAASLEALKAVARSHSLDAWCVAYRCPGPAYACATDSECRRCLACLHGCGSAATCSAGCLYRCGAEKLLTDFMTCAVIQHSCVELQKPTADGPGDAAVGDDCDVGNSSSLPSWGQPASLTEVGGRWFASRGGHPFHDCHECRTELVDPGAGLVVGSFLFDGVPVVNNRRVLQTWPENGTVLLGLSMVGHDVTEVWRLSWPKTDGKIDSAKDELMLSYCGNAGVWRYQGRLLLTRRLPRRGAPIATAGASGAAERRRSATFSCKVQHDNQCRRLLPSSEAGLHFADEL